MSVDILVESHGSVVLVMPQNADVREWLVEHVEDDAVWFGDNLAVEWRFVRAITDGATDAGYACELAPRVESVWGA